VAGWAYVRSQYYVGVDGRQVAIFRGVSGSVAGIAFSEVAERTDLRTERLDSLALSQVERGIVAMDRPDAQSIVARLEDANPECTPADEVPPLPTPTPRHRAARGADVRTDPHHRARRRDGAERARPLCPAGCVVSEATAATARPARRSARRGTELLLTTFAVLIAVLAYAAVGSRHRRDACRPGPSATASGSAGCSWSPTWSSAPPRPTPTRSSCRAWRC
jgi:hypothetical protein